MLQSSCASYAQESLADLYLLLAHFQQLKISIQLLTSCHIPSRWYHEKANTPLSTVSLSAISDPHGQLQSENIKWRTSEINNS